MDITPSKDRRLILISGAVASGKTRLAQGLAQLARTRGVTAASIDIDDLVETVAGSDWSSVTPAHRQLASELAACLTDRLFEAGTSIVAIAGSTLSPSEWQQVLGRLRATPRVTYVLLRVSVAEAARRARADPTRVATRDAAVVARLHRSIDWARVPSADIEIESDNLTTEEVAAVVWRRIFAMT